MRKPYHGEFPTGLCIPGGQSVSSGCSEPQRPSSCHPASGKTQRKTPVVVLGQHAVASPADTSGLDQARALSGLANTLDRAYLLQRIRDDSGDPALFGLI